MKCLADLDWNDVAEVRRAMECVCSEETLEDFRREVKDGLIRQVVAEWQSHQKVCRYPQMPAELTLLLLRMVVMIRLGIPGYAMRCMCGSDERAERQALDQVLGAGM